MRIWLAIPTRNQGLLAEAITAANTGWAQSDPGFLIHANGIALDWSDEDLLHAIQGSVGCYQSFSHRNIGVVAALQELYQLQKAVGSPDDIIGYIHDDVLITEEAWDHQLLDFFQSHPEVGLVGFHGSRRLGRGDLYKVPFNFPHVHSDIFQLARADAYSNMRDWSAHGLHATQPMRVATLDGFSLFCRISFLDQINGWTWWPKHLPHHSYDNALCCMAARHKFQVWLYPIACHHLGNRTAGTIDFVADFGKTQDEIHAESHIFLYWEFRDVLPISI